MDVNAADVCFAKIWRAAYRPTFTHGTLSNLPARDYYFNTASAIEAFMDRPDTRAAGCFHSEVVLCVRYGELYYPLTQSLRFPAIPTSETASAPESAPGAQNDT